MATTVELSPDQTQRVLVTNQEQAQAVVDAAQSGAITGRLPFQFCLLIGLSVSSLASSNAITTGRIEFTREIPLETTYLGRPNTDSGRYKSVTSLFEPKGKTMKEVATEVATLEEDGDILGLEFSADGKYLATSAAYRKTVHVWDWKNGPRIARTLETFPGAAELLLTTEPLSYSPDGRLLAYCGGGGKGNTWTRIWNAESGEVVRDIADPHPGLCMAVKFAPAGNSIIQISNRNSSSPGNNLTIYDMVTWQPQWGLRTTPSFEPENMALSPDGKLVALAGKAFVGPDRSIVGHIVIVDLVGRMIVRTLETYAHRVAWSPDGTRIAAGGGKDPILIFDAQSGRQVASERGESGRVLVRYTPDGKYLIESIYQTVKIWDAQHREMFQEIRAMPGSLAVSRDGRYFAMGGDKKVIVWQLR